MPLDDPWLTTRVTRPEHRVLLRNIVTADERLSAAEFAKVLTPKAAFRFGSAPAIVGRAEVERFVSNFFTTIASMRHDLDEVWEKRGLLAYEAWVTYGTSDGGKVSLPYANVLRLDGPLVCDYRIYIDPTPMSAGR